MLIFDTFDYAKKLQRAGLTEEQASVHVEALRTLIEHDLATKQDIANVQRDIADIHKEIEGKMSEATANPDMRESLTAESNGLMEKLSMLEAQVERLREALEQEGLRFEKKTSKKDKKEDEKEEK